MHHEIMVTANLTSLRTPYECVCIAQCLISNVAHFSICLQTINVELTKQTSSRISIGLWVKMHDVVLRSGESRIIVYHSAVILDE